MWNARKLCESWISIRGWLTWHRLPRRICGSTKILPSCRRLRDWWQVSNRNDCIAWDWYKVWCVWHDRWHSPDLTNWDESWFDDGGKRRTSIQHKPKIHSSQDPFRRNLSPKYRYTVFIIYCFGYDKDGVISCISRNAQVIVKVISKFNSGIVWITKPCETFCC